MVEQLCGSLVRLWIMLFLDNAPHIIFLTTLTTLMPLTTSKIPNTLNHPDANPTFAISANPDALDFSVEKKLPGSLSEDRAAT